MKRNTLTAAVLAGLTGVAGMASVANAVHVNPDGLGQVLLYPYYTARGGNDTLISIVNTTNRGKAVKVRFIEAVNSREVLDFNLYLSPFDVWTGAVTENDAGGGMLITRDTSCTVPYIFGQGGEQDFLDFEYADYPGSVNNRHDYGPQGIERTASGYIEVIEMGTMRAHNLWRGSDFYADMEDWLFKDRGYSRGDAETLALLAEFGDLVPWAIKHNADGVPNACGNLSVLWSPAIQWFGLPWIGFFDGPVLGNPDVADFTGQEDEDFVVRGSSGGLFGAGSIINVAQGTMFSYNAIAMEDFWLEGVDLAATTHVEPGTRFPDFTSSSNTTAQFITNGSIVDLDMGTSQQAVSATLMVEQLFNEYVISESIGARTEWVMTMPTKRFHTDAYYPQVDGLTPLTGSNIDPANWGVRGLSGGAVDPNAPLAPFTSTWHPVFSGATGAFLRLNHACEALSFALWDREERVPGAAFPFPIVSPQPPGFPPDQFEICREANVLRIHDGSETLGTSEILAETSYAGFPRMDLTNLSTPFDSGWIRFNFGGKPPMKGQDDADNWWDIYGLPMAGFAVTTYTNGNVGGTLSNYGGTFNHRGTRNVVESDD